LYRSVSGSDNKEKQMNSFTRVTKPLMWSMALLLTAFVAGCGGGQNPILGGGGIGVPDTTRPRVTVTVPVNAAVVAPTNAAITATFTEAMAPATITAAGTFTLTGPGTTAVAGAVTYVVASKTAVFKPTAVLTVGTVYTATISIAAKDLAGNALAGNQAALPAASSYIWTFTASAADTTPPLISLESPVDLGTAVAVNSTVNATFNKAMDPTSITFTLQASGPPLGTALAGAVTYDPLTNIATFTPTALLATSTNYTATVGGKDLAGNALVVPGVVSLVPPVNKPNPWTFATAASAAPVPLAINLGSAVSFGIASRAGMTSTGVTVVNGDVALHPTATCTDSTGNAGASQTCLVKTYVSTTGLTVNGSIYYAGDPFDSGATALKVTNDLNTAWVEGQNKIDTFATGFLVGQLGATAPGKTLLPGVYHEAALGLAVGNVVNFDAQGDPNAVFIIKVDSSFVDSGTLLQPTQVVLLNGAKARNIWFVAGLDITIGSGTTWNGNILAGRTATILDGSALNGRVLAGATGAGAITLTGAASPSVTSITVPQ
jgi:hypothetical protein